MADFIEIRKDGMSIKIPRNQFGDIVESPDGLVFQLKNGFHIVYADYEMQSQLKRTLKLSVDNFQKGNLIINLNNYRNPTSVELT